MEHTSSIRPVFTMYASLIKNDGTFGAPLRRLADVGMNCGCEYTAFPLFARTLPYSRRDHSAGTARIVWHFTACPAQAAAALLHDVATPVFAHTVDFLHGDHLRQESTEADTAAVIAASPEVTAVLARYGLDTADVSDYHRYQCISSY